MNATGTSYILHPSSLLLDAAAALDLDDVQAALFLLRPRPPAGALVFPVTDRAGAGPAADARVVLIVERIIRHPMLDDVTPHVLLRPAQKWVDLHQVEFGVPLNH